MLNNSIKSELLIGTVKISAPLCQSVRELLEQTRNQLVSTINCTELQGTAHLQAIDILLIDLDNLKCNQLGFLKQMANYPQMGIVALGENIDEAKIVDFYAHGVDDYITKPCTYQEVVFRIEVLTRRLTWSTARPQPATFCFDGIVMDSSTNEVGICNHLIRLNPIEFQLLSAFMRKPNVVIGAEDLFQEVWGYEVRGFQKLLDLAIRHLQQKVEATIPIPVPWQILAIDKGGYQFHPSGSMS